MKLPDLTPKGDLKGGAGAGGIYGDWQPETKPKDGFLRSNLFIFLCGQVVTMSCGLVFFAVAWGKLSQQFVESMEWRAVTQSRMERMDKEGTNFGKNAVEAEKTRDEYLESRVKQIEENTRGIDVMKATLQRLEATQPVKR